MPYCRTIKRLCDKLVRGGIMVEGALLGTLLGGKTL